MSFVQISNKQLVSTVVSIILSVVASVWFMKALTDYLDLPEVYLNTNGTCVKVVNFKNGDAFVCQNKDVTLRKYTIVRVQ